MTITKKIFRRIILLTILFVILEASSPFLPFLTNYETLNKEVFQGYELYPIFTIFFIIAAILYFISIGLLYFFKPIGRPFYLLGFIGTVLGMMVSADYVVHNMTYPISMILSFLDIFILYIIYFTPFKQTFDKNKSKKKL